MAESKKEKAETEEAFSERMGLMLADACTMLSVSLGWKIGLFEKLLSYDAPKTCKEIADDAGLKERYLQEWMGVMVTGKIVDLHKTSDGYKYMIPQHRRNTLSSKGSGMAGIAFCLPILAQVHGEMEACFKKGGPRGISYDSYQGFHEWEYFSLQSRIDEIISTLDEVPGLIKALESGINICDLGCSAGYTTIQIAQKFPKSQIHGADISEEAITKAKKAVSDKGVSNCHFHIADVANMPADWTEKWDFIIMYDVLHDVPNVTKALAEILRVLKKGAYVIIVEMNLHTKLEDNADNRYAPSEYGFSLFSCLPASLYFEGSQGMGGVWGKEKALQMMKEAGLNEVKEAKVIGGEVALIGRK